MGRFSIQASVFFLALGLSACGVNDYWYIPEELTVDSTVPTLETHLSEPFEQDLFVRYQLDYRVENLNTARATQVVVSARSMVNGIFRATGQKVWRLEPGAVGEGILTSSQLELGNALDVSLHCCASSACRRREVTCEEEGSALYGQSAEAVAGFCYGACSDSAPCLESCPSEQSCVLNCASEADVANCRKTACVLGAPTSTCSSDCLGDAACLATCQASVECTSDCVSQRATCFRNCLATWMQCTDVVYTPNTELIPCGLCGGEGLCKVNTTPNAAFELTSEDGSQTYPCELACQKAAPACVVDCERFYTELSAQIACTEKCLQQQIFWCNDYSIPLDYVDSRVPQPCCYDDYCHNALTAVIKSLDVECFNDSSCGVNRHCSDEGVCVSAGGSSCMLGEMRKSQGMIPWLLLALLGLCLCPLRWRKQS